MRYSARWVSVPFFAEGAHEGGDGDSGLSASVSRWTTAVGDIVMVACDSTMAAVPSLPDNRRGGLAVLCLPHDVADRRQARKLAEMSRDMAENDHAGQGDHWAFVRKGLHQVVSGEGGPHSEICDPAGRVIAAAETCRQCIVIADFPM